MIRLSNYKLEVENTEKLNGDINSAFTEINTELKKDDDLIASDLFDVDKCIEELKKSRKKWASGVTEITNWVRVKKVNNSDGYTDIGVIETNTTFSPTVFFGIVYDTEPLPFYINREKNSLITTSNTETNPTKYIGFSYYDSKTSGRVSSGGDTTVTTYLSSGGTGVSDRETYASYYHSELKTGTKFSPYFSNTSKERPAGIIVKWYAFE